MHKQMIENAAYEVATQVRAVATNHLPGRYNAQVPAEPKSSLTLNNNKHSNK